MANPRVTPVLTGSDYTSAPVTFNTVSGRSNSRAPDLTDPLVLDSVQRLSETARAAVYGTSAENPDEAALVFRLSQESGLDPDTTRRNLAEIQGVRRLEEIDYDKAALQAPATAKLLADPNFSRVAQDDADNLSNIEWLLGKTRFREPGEPPATLKREKRDVLGQTVDVTKREPLLGRGEITQPGAISRGFQAGMEQLESARIADQAQAAWAAGDKQKFNELAKAQLALEARGTADYKPKGALQKVLSWGVRAVVENLPYMGAAAIEAGKEGAMAGMAAGVALAPTMAVPNPVTLFGAPLAASSFAAVGAGLGAKRATARLEASGMYWDLVNNRGMDPGKAKAYADAYGEVAGMTEVLLDRMLLGGGAKGLKAARSWFSKSAAAKDLLTAPSKRAVVGEVAKTLGIEMAGSQGAEEWAQARAQNVFTHAAEGKGFTAPITPEEKASEWEQAALGALGGVLLGGWGGVSIYVDGMQKVRDAEKTRDLFAALNEVAKDSTAKQKLPEAIRTMVDEMAADGKAPTHVYAQEGVLSAFLQQNGIAPTQLDSLIPGFSEALRAAPENDGFVKVPMADWAAHVAGTPMGEALAQDVKIDPDRVTYNQRAELQREMAEQHILLKDTLLDAFEKETPEERSPGSQIIADFVDRAVAAGRTKEEATNAAGLAAARAVRLAEIFQAAGHEEVTPWDIYTRRDFSIVGPEGQTLAPKTPARDFSAYAKAVHAAHTATGEGSSVDLDSGESISGKPGFGVAMHPDRWLSVAGENLTPDAIARYAEKNADLLQPGSGKFVGTWKNPDTGDVELDISTRILDFGEAMRIARENKQDAIWDYQNMRAIPTGYDRLTDEMGPAPETYEQSSVALRTGKETLEPYGLVREKTKAGKPKKLETLDYKEPYRRLAEALDARQRALSGVIARNDFSEEAEQKLARWLVEEVKFELQPERAGQSGAGWYSTKYQRALDHFAELYPELKTDTDRRNLFTVLVAITSDGSKVFDNFTHAVEIYGGYRETGKFAATRGHVTATASVKKNLEHLQHLLEKLGTEKLQAFLLRETTVEKLRPEALAHGVKFNTSYKPQQKLPMAAGIFGPKLGAFYANLSGAEGYLTMDRWWSRTFNRLRGVLAKTPTTKGLARFRGLIGQPDLTREETIRATIPYALAYKAKAFKNGTEIEKAANSIYKAEFRETRDAPAGPNDRAFMIRTILRVKKNLAQAGHKISVADIQAVLWYYEKRLSGELGARSTADVSYEEAARRVVRNLQLPESGRPAPRTTGVSFVEGPDGNLFEVERDAAEGGDGEGQTFYQRNLPAEDPFLEKILPPPGHQETREERHVRLRENLERLGISLQPKDLHLHHFQRNLHPIPGATATVDPIGMGTGVGSGAERFRGGPKKSFWYRAAEGGEPTGYTPEWEVTGQRAQNFRFDIDRSWYLFAAGTDEARAIMSALVKADPLLAAKDPYSGGALFDLRGPDRWERVEYLLHDMGFDGLLGHPDQPGTENKVVSVFFREEIRPEQGDKIIDLREDPEAFTGALRRGEQTFNQESAAFRAPEVRSPEGKLPAPNGKPSNLNERQWHQVRSPQFKAWFGDWENDPANASKVVDENGEPKVVYRGDTKDLEELKPGGPETGRAVFFATDPTAAGRFAMAQGGNITPVFLSAKKPFDYQSEESLSELRDFLGLDEERLKWWQGDPEAEWYMAAANGAWDLIESPEFQAFLRDRGFDGFFVVEGGDRNVAVFTPTQIKSAIGNSGEFSPTDARILYQPAYHGSPYKFDKFSLEHMGKGEGAQAFGWGLYFAGSKEVARWYRENLSSQSTHVAFIVNGEKLPDGPERHGASLLHFNDVREIRSVAKRWLKEAKAGDLGMADTARLAGLSPEEYWTRLNAFVQTHGRRDIKIERGRLYKVDLKPADDEWLLWDKPLSEQSAKVRAALARLGADDMLRGVGYGRGVGDPRMTGDTFYARLSLERGRPNGRNDRAASLALLAAGIPGIKYYDGTSRNSTQDSFNYVVFDDSLVEIEEYWQPTQTSGVNASITLTDDRVVVNLFKTANKSSLVHELGHLFLSDLEHFASQPNAPAAIVAEFAAARKWLGVAEGAKLTTEHHETFARAWERYLMEGRAPTQELVSIFERFAEWLLKVYRHAVALNAPMNDEIRGWFDRMLASEADIADAEAYHGAASSARMDLLAAYELTEKERARVEARRKKAKLTALQARRQRILKAYTRALGGKARFVELAIAEMNDIPEYKAFDSFAAGQGLDAAELDQLVGEEKRKALSKKRPGSVALSDGRSVAMAAEFFGFPSGPEMVDALLAAETKEAFKDRRVAEMVAQAEADVDQAAGGLPADADYHNEDRLKLLLETIQILESKQGQGQPQQLRDAAIQAKAIRTVAQERLAALTAKQAADFARFSREEVKARRKALSSADGAKALTWARAEALAHAMALESLKIREEMAKADKVLAAAPKAKIADAWQQQLYQLLGRTGLDHKGRVKPDTPSLEKFLADLANSDELMGTTPTWSSWLTSGQPINRESLSLEQARELRDAVKWLIGVGRDLLDNRLLTYGVPLKEKVGEVVKPMIGLKPKSIWKEGTVARWWSDSVRKYLAEHDMLGFLLDKADGYRMIQKGAGAAWRGPNREMHDRLAAAGSAYDRRMKDLHTRLQGPLTVLLAWRKNMGDKNPAPGVSIPGPMLAEGRTWNPERVLAAALNMGNHDNILRLAHGFGMALPQDIAKGEIPQVLRDLTASLTDTEWAAIQEIWDIVDSYWPEISDVHQRINHFRQKKIEAQALTTPGGLELRGGYYPAIYDGILSAKVGEWNEKDDLLNQTEAIFQTPAARSGFTKGRATTGGGRPLNLSLSVLHRHLTDVNRYITHAEVLRDIDRVTGNEDYRAEFSRAFGRQAYEMIRPALKWVANPSAPAGSWLDRVANAERGRATAYILGLNLSVAAKQLFGVAPAIRDLGLKTYVSGWAKLMQDPSGAFAMMHKLSPYMESRAKDFERDIADAVRHEFDSPSKTLMGVSLKDVQDFSFAFVQTADFLMAFPVWTGAYQKMMRETNGDTEASVQYADSMVRNTQASAKPIDLSFIQRESGIKRVFSFFMSGVGNYSNRQRHFWGAWRQGKISTREYATHVILEAIAPPVLMQMLFSALWGNLGDEWEDPEDALLGLFLEVLSYNTAGLIVIRDIVGAIVGKLKGEKYQSKPWESPIWTGYKLGERVFKDAASLDPEKIALSLAELFSYALKIPAPKFARRLVKGWEQWQSGEGTPANVLFPEPGK